MALILIVNFILQSTVFQHISVMGVMPDTALVLVVSLGIFTGKERGAVIGAAAGMLQDIVYGKPVGITAFSYMAIGYFVGETGGKVFKERLVVPVVITAGATLVKYSVNIFFNYVLGVSTQVFMYIRNYLPVELLYNCIVSALLYRVLYAAYNGKIVKRKPRIKRKGR